MPAQIAIGRIRAIIVPFLIMALVTMYFLPHAYLLVKSMATNTPN